MSGQPKKSWVFVWNNYGPDDVSYLKNWEGVNYMVVGFEVGESGTPHLQGFVTFKKSIRFNALKRTYNEKIHWEEAKDDIQQGPNYCMKGGKYEILHDRREQGKRSDLSEACELARTQGLKRVKEDHPETYVKYHRGLAELIKPSEPYFGERKIHWYWGPTGAGKSRRAWEEAGFEGTCSISMNSAEQGRYFGEYAGQDKVIFDDLRPDSMPFVTLLRILDRYPTSVGVKGTTVPWRASQIWVTSSTPPESFNTSKEDVEQLLRRLREWGIVEFMTN